ncbi:MAG TPA: hypothetical protein VHZ03_12740 [Trebonia sp.]|jgi:hypothetical protein|nr:hypothetical protein [Trebonia sp.]
MTRQAFLITRGTANRLDYRFLGLEPRNTWWSVLRDHQVVNLNGTEVIAYGDGRSLGILLAGIPSARRDAVGTAIRFTLVVDGLQDDPALAARLAWTGLDAGSRARLGERLDGAFDTDLVDAILSKTKDGAPVAGLLDGVLDGDWEDTTPSAAGPTESRQPWAGPVDLPAARAQFLTRVAWLADGQQGYAFTSSRLSSQAGADEELQSLPGCGAILLADGELTTVKYLKKDAAPQQWWQDPETQRLVLLSSAGVVVAALIVLGIWKLLAH